MVAGLAFGIAVVRLHNFVTMPLVRLIQALPSTAWRPHATLIDMN